MPDVTADFLKALGHPTRLQIVKTLLEGEKCVSGMEDLLKLRQANVSQHLNTLKAQNIVKCTVNGTLRCYSLVNPGLIASLLNLIEEEHSNERTI